MRKVKASEKNRIKGVLIFLNGKISMSLHHEATEKKAGGGKRDERKERKSMTELAESVSKLEGYGT